MCTNLDTKGKNLPVFKLWLRTWYTMIIYEQWQAPLPQISPLTIWYRVSMSCKIPNSSSSKKKIYKKNKILLNTIMCQGLCNVHFLNESFKVILTMTLWRGRYYFLLFQWVSWSTDKFNDFFKVIFSMLREQGTEQFGSLAP